MFPPRSLRPRTVEDASASSFHQAKTCDRMFDLLKQDSSERVPVSSLLARIKDSGIQLNDPRLRDLMANVRSLQQAQEEQLDLQDEAALPRHVSLDRQAFRQAVQQNAAILLAALKDELAVPEFADFAAEVSSIFERCRDNCEGQVAQYIPQLKNADPKSWAVSVCTVDGQRVNIGDYQKPFSLQSVSKPINYALAMSKSGTDFVHKYVGYEPSGISYNSIALNADKKPHNPMINSGAIVVCSLMFPGKSRADRFQSTMNEYRRMSGGEHLAFCNPTFLSERDTANRNFALSYYMMENNCFPPDTDLKVTLDFYLQLCSLEATCESASVIAATLANGGICPLTGDKVLSADAVRDTLSLMHSCGMYDYSGQFAFKCGLPAKSGLSGIILLVVPNLVGFAIWSPRLDKQGNSCRGIQFCQELVARYTMHHYDSLLLASTSKRDPRSRKSEALSTPLVSVQLSAANNDVASLRRAFLQGARMNQPDYDGRTALHVAAAEGHLEVVRFLLDICRVDPQPIDRWGFTPASDAERFGHPEVLRLLGEATGRFSPPSEDSEGEMPGNELWLASG